MKDSIEHSQCAYFYYKFYVLFNASILVLCCSIVSTKIVSYDWIFSREISKYSRIGGKSRLSKRFLPVQLRDVSRRNWKITKKKRKKKTIEKQKCYQKSPGNKHF